MSVRNSKLLGKLGKLFRQRFTKVKKLSIDIYSDNVGVVEKIIPRF